MSWLKRFKASPQNLIGPDFKIAEELIINLSNTTVRYKNPPLTCMIPYVHPITELDIYKSGALFEPIHKHETAKARPLSENGWNFYSGLFSDSSAGGILVDLALDEPIPARTIENSLFNKQQLINWIIEDQEVTHKQDNLERQARHKEEGRTERLELIQYPRSATEIEKLKYNGQTWLKYMETDSWINRIIYCTAIGHTYLLTLTIQPSSYKGVDYNSTAHNLPEAVDKAIEELMQSMHITLSPQAQQQYEEAMNAESSSSPANNSQATAC